MDVWPEEAERLTGKRESAKKKSRYALLTVKSGYGSNDGFRQ